MAAKIFSLRSIPAALLTLSAFFCAVSSDIIVTPPLLAIEAQGGEASFTCTVTAVQGAVSIQWYIQFVSRDAYYWPFHQAVLQGMGFMAETSGLSSTLQVPATTATNGTLVKCMASLEDIDITSESSRVYVFDRPSRPTNLSLSAAGERRLIFAWSPVFAPAGVVTWYTVIVRDETEGGKVVLNSSAAENVSYEYRHYTSDPPCHVYTFSVMASNAAGNGNPSESVATTIPIVPKLSLEPVHVQITFNPAFINYWIQPPNVCPDFPVKGYFLKLQNMNGGSTVSFGPYSLNPNASNLHIAIPLSSGLQKESMYNCTVEVFNTVGSCTAALVLYTTDVQSSTITGSDHKLNVTCFFAEGTQARGCAVCLEKSGEVTYQMVPRVNETAKGVIRTEFSVDCYNISVVDWEEDGSTGPLYIPTNINVNLQAHCDSTTGVGLVALDSSIPVAMYIVISTAFATIVVLVMVIIILLGILRHYWRNSKTDIPNKMPQKPRLRTQQSTSSESYLLPSPVTEQSLPSTSCEQSLPSLSSKQTCLFPSSHCGMLDSLHSSTMDTGDCNSRSTQV